MEIFWLVAGVAVLAFASYLYFYNIESEDLGIYFMAGSMAVMLSIFRIIYRKNVVEKSDKHLNPKK